MTPTCRPHHCITLTYRPHDCTLSVNLPYRPHNCTHMC